MVQLVIVSESIKEGLNRDLKSAIDKLFRKASMMEKHEYVSLRRRFMSCFPSSSAPSHLYVTHLSLPLQITLN